MDDFFDKQTTENTEVEKIKIGEEEFTQDQLSKYVGLGKLAEEAETKYNTKIDRVWPEYSRAQNELKELRTYKEEQERLKNETPEVPEDEAVKQAREAARKVGLVTDDDFEQKLSKSFRQFFLQERAAEKLLEESQGLEKKYSGEDGRPKFDTNDILNYMQETGIRDPEKAYKVKNETVLDRWKEEQLRKSRRPGLVTQSSTIAGGKTPAPVKVTKENLDQLVRESLNLDD